MNSVNQSSIKLFYDVIGILMALNSLIALMANSQLTFQHVFLTLKQISQIMTNEHILVRSTNILDHNLKIQISLYLRLRPQNPHPRKL